MYSYTFVYLQKNSENEEEIYRFVNFLISKSDNHFVKKRMFSNFLHKAQNLVQSTVSAATGNGLTGQTLNIGGQSVTIGDKLAEGGYGCVYRANDMSGRQYAVKVLQAPDEEHYEAIKREFNFQKIASENPNVVKVYGMTTEPNTRQATILMEFCTGECVKEMNQNFSQGFNTRHIIEIFSQICEAVNFMHEQNPPISHRDLKVENILYNNGKYKLCDFGSATTKVYTLDTNEDRNIASDDIQRNTTATYRSPEMCDLYRRHKIDTKADVWALGGVLFKLCTFKDAFPDGSNLQILNCRYNWPSDRQVDPRCKKIVEMCFESDPSKRPTCRQVLAALATEFPDIVDQKWKSGQAPPQPQQQQQAPPPQQQQPQQPVHFSRNAGMTASEDTFDPFGTLSASNSSPNFDLLGGSPFASGGKPFTDQSPLASPQSKPFSTLPPKPLQPQQPAQPKLTFAQLAENHQLSASADFTQSVPSSSFTQSAPQPGDSLIDFNENAANANSGANVEPMLDLSSGSPALDPKRMETDEQNLIVELLKLPDIELSSSLFSLNTANPDVAEIFFFSLLHASGTRGPQILTFIPQVKTPQLQAVFDQHKEFSRQYPQFEGNFALGAFMQANRAHPPPVGHAPVSADVAKHLLSFISTTIAAVRVIRKKPVAEEAFFAYQITAYILAKLKQFKVNEGYINSTSIPLFTNHHSQLKRAFSQFQEKIPFPESPFDFNSADFLKRIRPPASKPLPK